MGVFNAGLPASVASVWPSTRQIVNAYSAGGYSTTLGTLNGIGRNILTGSLVAGVLSNILTIIGRAEVPLLTLVTMDATARTLRLQVVVDGVIVFDPTSNSIVTSGNGLGAASPLQSSSGVFMGNPIRSNSSIVVNVASSLTETAKAQLSYTAQVF